jgi:hypothetical protein
MQLCRQVGQFWRAVSLGGAGELGPLPVGLAAAEMESLEEGVQAEDLSWEVDTGSGHMRQLWKWACCQASEQISSSTSGGRPAAAAGSAGCRAWQRTLTLGHSQQPAPMQRRGTPAQLPTCTCPAD